MAAKPANPDQPKQGKVRKLSPSMQRYKDQGREAANKKRNVATDLRRQARDAELRPEREMLRKAGALRRLDRRIRATSGKKKLRAERARLQEIRIKVDDACRRAEDCAPLQQAA